MNRTLINLACAWPTLLIFQQYVSYLHATLLAYVNLSPCFIDGWLLLSSIYSGGTSQLHQRLIMQSVLAKCVLSHKSTVFFSDLTEGSINLFYTFDNSNYFTNNRTSFLFSKARAKVSSHFYSSFKSNQIKEFK